MPARFTLARNSRTSRSSSGRPRHWLAFFVKICSASHRWTTARSTARGIPPATDMCAPKRGIVAGPWFSVPRAEFLLEHYAVRRQLDEHVERIRAPRRLRDGEQSAREPHVAPADGCGAGRVDI